MNRKCRHDIATLGETLQNCVEMAESIREGLPTYREPRGIKVGSAALSDVVTYIQTAEMRLQDLARQIDQARPKDLSPSANIRG